MNEELLKPSLDENENNITQTYDISKLFYVAFLGGIIPTVILSSINMRGLNFKNKIITFLAAVGACLILLKAYITGLFFLGDISVSARDIRLISRIASVVLYCIYFFIMKNKYRQHIMLNGEVKPLLKDAIKYIIIGSVLELIIISLVRSLI